MAVLVRDPNPLPQQQYDGMASNAQLIEAIKNAPGFIAHLAVPGPNGITVMEIWESRENADRWLQDVILPAMRQAGIPQETQPDYQDLHNIILPGQ